MSSEIGTPMKAIIDITDELIAEFPRKDQRDSLNQLKSSNEKLLILIKDIVNSEARIQNNRNIC
jgi:signal transduction histidine kinase